jgi:hypothetical protein
MRALVAASDLMRAAHLRKHSDVDVLDISAGDADRHDVLGLAGGRARVATDAAGVVDDLGPLDAILASWFWLDHSGFCASDKIYAPEYIMECRDFSATSADLCAFA